LYPPEVPLGLAVVTLVKLVEDLVDANPKLVV